MRKIWLFWNDRNKSFPFNNRGDISWLGPGYGQLLAGNDFMGNPPASDTPPAPPTSPDPAAAEQTALDAQNKQRRILLATGGQTEYAGNSSSLIGDNINSINLTGV